MPVGKVSGGPVMSTLFRRIAVASLFACAPAASAHADQSDIQRALAAVGCYDGPIDGAASLALRTAVRCFQKNGLDAPPDGTLSPEEEEALHAAAAAGVNVARGQRYIPAPPRAADMPAAPTPAPAIPTPVPVAPAQTPEEKLLAERAARFAAEWRDFRDRGVTYVEFGDGRCWQDDLHGGMSVCQAYLMETTPADRAIFCAGQLDRSAFTGPGFCLALPAALCHQLGGRMVEPFRVCMRPEDENDPKRGYIDYSGKPLLHMHHAVAAAADWIGNLGRPLAPGEGRAAFEQAVAAGIAALMEGHVANERDRIEQAGGEDLQELRTWEAEGRADERLLQRVEFGFLARTVVSCGPVLEHPQLSEIVQGTVSKGPHDGVAAFCRHATGCARAMFLWDWRSPETLRDFDLVRRASASALCFGNSGSAEFADFRDRPVSHAEIQRQLLRAGNILDFLAEDPAAIPEERVRPLLERAGKLAADDVFGIDPETERGAIYDLALRRYGITLQDIARAVSAAGSR